MRAIRTPLAPAFRGRDAGKTGLDRLLYFLAEFSGVLADGFDRLADDDADRARLFHEPASRPERAGVVRYGHHALAGCDREQRAAHPELAGLSRDHPRALRKNNDPQTVPKPRLALFDHLVHGPMPLAAVDGDRPQQLQSPTDEGDPQQFPFQHPDL